MNRTFISLAVIPALLAGCAATPRAQPQQQTASASSACATQVASRIPTRPGECAVSPTRSYSERDIQNTGQVDAGSALQLLDPSITVHH